MSNDSHIADLMKGIAVAVETKIPFSAELVENDAASSIRWKRAPPPPKAKPKVDDGNLYSSIKKALDRVETKDPSLTSICNRLKSGLAFMPQGSAHITCLRLTELETVCNVL